jgi:hypothetical protein
MTQELKNAIAKHNIFVHDQIEIAKTGQPICLTDLMVSRENIIEKTINDGHGKPFNYTVEEIAPF